MSESLKRSLYTRKLTPVDGFSDIVKEYYQSGGVDDDGAIEVIAACVKSSEPRASELVIARSYSAIERCWWR